MRIYIKLNAPNGEAFMNESRFKCAAVKMVRRELPDAWVYHPSDRWNSGIPDLLILWNGVFAAIELKVGRNTATKLQLVVLERIRAAGGITAVCYDIRQVRDVISKLKFATEGRDL
jgi:hypothetical protein